MSDQLLQNKWSAVQVSVKKTITEAPQAVEMKDINFLLDDAIVVAVQQHIMARLSSEGRKRSMRGFYWDMAIGRRALHGEISLHISCDKPLKFCNHSC